MFRLRCSSVFGQGSIVRLKHPGKESIEDMIKRCAPLRDITSWYVLDVVDRCVTLREAAKTLGISIRCLRIYREDLGIGLDQRIMPNMKTTTRDRIENRTRFNRKLG